MGTINATVSGAVCGELLGEDRSDGDEVGLGGVGGDTLARHDALAPVTDTVPKSDDPFTSNSADDVHEDSPPWSDSVTVDNS